MSIIFTKTPYEYDSYRDFWTLVELAGFPISTIGDIDPDADNTYIFTPMNGDVEGLLPRWKTPKERRAQIVWWFLERLDSTPMLTDGTFERYLPYMDQVWTSDGWMATQHPALKHVILGSHEKLGNPRTAISYDFTHQSYVCPRRFPVYDRIRKLGLREGPNGWGDARDHVLRATQVMVHVQQFHLPLYTPLRFSLAAAYRLPLVSEALTNPYPLDASSIIQAPISEIPSTVQRVARNPSNFGDGLYDALCIRHPFRVEVEKAV